MSKGQRRMSNVLMMKRTNSKRVDRIMKIFKAKLLTDSPVRKALAVQQKIPKTTSAITTLPKSRGRPRKANKSEEPCGKRTQKSVQDEHQTSEFDDPDYIPT